MPDSIIDPDPPKGGDPGSPPASPPALPPAPDAPPPPNCEARAAVAEAKVDQLTRELDAIRAELNDAREHSAAADRARDLQRLLIQARAVDLDATTLLAQRDLDAAPTSDLAAVVSDLRRRKPHLFRAAPASASMSPHAPADTGTGADDLARHAAATGDRRALLRYLQARRR